MISFTNKNWIQLPFNKSATEAYNTARSVISKSILGLQKWSTAKNKLSTLITRKIHCIVPILYPNIIFGAWHVMVVCEPNLESKWLFSCFRVFVGLIPNLFDCKISQRKYELFFVSWAFKIILNESQTLTQLNSHQRNNRNTKLFTCGHKSNFDPWHCSRRSFESDPFYFLYN